MKGQTAEESIGIFLFIVLSALGLVLAMNIYQENSDNYVERDKLENAQSKVSKLQSTVDRKDQRIDNLEEWKENYSELQEENQQLREQLNQSENQETETDVSLPPINIEHPWGVSLAALIGLIIGVILPSSVFGYKGYFTIPIPEMISNIVEDEEQANKENEEKEKAEQKAELG